MSTHKKLTTASGRIYVEHEDTMSAGPRGPLLLQDYILHEKLAHFNRERIPERIVHAKGSGAFGTFTVTHDITKYTRAKLFSEIGKQTRLFIRFSTVGGEKGSADTERDPRGFAVKFYTEDGNFDLVGNNTPIFFIKDPKKFPDFIHTQKRDPYTNLKSPTAMWDFWSLNPESLHQVLFVMTDRGTPYTYRHMHGFGSHTLSMINSNNERYYVKYHFKTAQGIKNFTGPEADQMRATDMDFAQRDLVESIEKGDFPKWHLKIQVMSEKEAETYHINPFDLTKVWPHSDYPLIDVGVMELNENPDNYFQDVEQAAFNPTNIVPGVGFSPDRMLQGRLFSYGDAQRYRLGVNHHQIPVNHPRGIKDGAYNSFHRDGQMRVDGNHGATLHYEPNSYSVWDEQPEHDEPAQRVDGDIKRWDFREDDDNYYEQPGKLFRLMDHEAQQRLFKNTANNMGDSDDIIKKRHIGNCYKADPAYGRGVADALGISYESAGIE